ncbi:MAG: nucleoside deaminase [Muribaculaceae bacterium]|nr:nucleoside deaminase [Muribaculaceae bacterium]MDE6485889.1 nucleoside deaminase [Muribaculaceae bacterium]
MTDHAEAADIRYMRLAIAEARRAAAIGEVPIGAIVVSPSGAIIGRGHNLTERLLDVTAHAEMQAITAAAATLAGKYLDGCTLYVTVEPCLMCAGAIGWSHIARIVVGTPDPKGGYTANTIRPPFHPRARITFGILADECRAIMQEFFKTRRRCTTS